MWHVVDILFFIFHSFVILINVFGFLWSKTQKLQLIVLSTTTFSWLALAPWYGLGFCFCTEWHWQVREILGDTDLPLSYIVWLFDVILGVQVSDLTGNIIASSGLIFGWIGALAVLYLKIRKNKS